MNRPSSSSPRCYQSSPENDLCNPPIPAGLRRQGRVAVVLLAGIWLSFSMLVLVSAEERIGAFLLLIPGLGIVVHISAVLSSRLGDNHRIGEQQPLFPTLGAGNWITMARAALVGGLAALVPVTLYHGNWWAYLTGWLAGGVYLSVCLADLLDGFVARKQGQVTELGAALDIATDGAGLLAASLIACFLGRVPAICILVGLAYYLFVLGRWWRQYRGLPVAELRYRPYGRIIAGFQMGLFSMVLFPVFDTTYTRLAAVIFLIPFLAGFSRDWLVVSCRVATDDNQRCRLDNLFDDSVSRLLSLGARLVLGGSAFFLVSAGAAAGIGAGWIVACGALAGLAVAGFLGRVAAQLLLVVLGLSASPFGGTAAATLCFSSATVLLLAGSGPFSLWRPEEDILYRRKSEAPGT
jgi:phosphatidylglycerophosphate synthase